MLALLLYLWLGPRAAFAELVAELLIGLALSAEAAASWSAPRCDECWRFCGAAASSPPNAG